MDDEKRALLAVLDCAREFQRRWAVEAQAREMPPACAALVARIRNCARELFDALEAPALPGPQS